MYQYNLSWIQIVQLLTQMSVVVGDGLPYSWAISADQQWLNVFLSDDPTVADITQVNVDLTPVIPATPLPPPSALTVTDCVPTTAEIGSEDLMLLVHGTMFQPTTVILFSSLPEPTTVVSSTELATIVKPSLWLAPAVVPVQVQDGTTITPPDPSPITFTFTDVAIQVQVPPAEPEPIAEPELTPEPVEEPI